MEIKEADNKNNPEITPLELKKMIDKKKHFTLIDVRDPHEYQICRIEGSILMPLSQLASHVNRLDQTGEIIAHCYSGKRSLDAVKVLNNLGFHRVRSLKGGIKAWSKEIDPTIPMY